MQNFLESYWSLQKEYSEKYGPNTCVAMQKGTFYEVYTQDNIGKAPEVANCLNFQLTRCDKKDTSSPLLVGLPISNIKKYASRLIKSGFTVVTVDETDIPGKRRVSKIYSPGTFAESDESLLLVSFCILFENGIIDIGMSTIDTITGETCVTEYLSGDNTCRIERAAGDFAALKPNEVILCVNNLPQSLKSSLVTMIGLTSFHEIELDKTYISIEYQNEVLKQVFGGSLLTPLEHLNMTHMESGVLSLLNILQFCYEHDEDILKNLKEPNIKMDNYGLVLHNNVVSQLNVINNTGSGSKSMFDILDKTHTTMGRKALKHILCNPIANITELKAIHQEVENLIPVIKWHDELLVNVADIEKHHRKLFTYVISPQQWGALHVSYENILTLLRNTTMEIYESERTKCKENFVRFFGWFEETFELAAMQNENMCPFKKGIYPEIDEIHIQVTEIIKSLKEETTKMSKLLNKQDDVIKIEYTTNGTGVYLSTTPNRASELCKKRKCYFQKKESKTKSIISSETINMLIDSYVRLSSTFNPMVKEKYLQCVKYCVEKYKKCLEDVAYHVAQIDLMCSRAKTASLYAYTKPEFMELEESSIQAKELRHALIEKLDSQVPYIPSDVRLGHDQRGVLLYGINGSGKSCYSKAVGLAIIMAQSGHWVAAKDCVISPFTNMYTRTTCDDNIYKGHSSFFVEMTELKTILSFADSKSIVIGDEICKGTEETSALSIVGATIKWLQTNKVKFIFATHLHKLVHMKCLQETNLPPLKIMHIHVEYDVQNDIFVYNRLLKEGQGDTIYGIEIASKILNNIKFSRVMNSIKKDISTDKKRIVSTKKSRYNTKITVDSCQVCGANDGLETHHIVPQSIDPSLITERSNLVVLCKICHNNVHSNKLVISGWVCTSNGEKLDFKVI